VNPHLLPTLRLLGGDTFRSGEEVAQRLGVTRATVWNMMQEAQQLGLPVEKVRGQGYRLPHPPVWLDAAAVTAAMGVHAGRFHLDIQDELSSTNTVMLARAAAGAPSGSVVAAELQTGGRGRRGRTWLSGLGGALTFSLLWRFDDGPASLSGLSLVVGLACAKALAARGVQGVGVKWPNDLLCDGRKLGGILIELQGDALGPSAVVIGIGFNVRLAADIPEVVDQPVADLAGTGGSEDRNALLATVLTELAIAIDAFLAGGFSAVADEFDRWHVLRDRDVVVSLPDGSRVEGRVTGTAPDGALLVDTAAGPRRFHGGEVSVRASTANVMVRRHA
jgi:BirA family transcriptional regulator, biotin operon repressor / biotin---[acetyl-CoA-carboxylase] ligase